MNRRAAGSEHEIPGYARSVPAAAGHGAGHVQRNQLPMWGMISGRCGIIIRHLSVIAVNPSGGHTAEVHLVLALKTGQSLIGEVGEDPFFFRVRMDLRDIFFPDPAETASICIDQVAVGSVQFVYAVKYGAVVAGADIVDPKNLPVICPRVVAVNLLIPGGDRILIEAQAHIRDGNFCPEALAHAGLRQFGFQFVRFVFDFLDIRGKGVTVRSFIPGRDWRPGGSCTDDFPIDGKQGIFIDDADDWGIRRGTGAEVQNTTGTVPPQEFRIGEVVQCGGTGQMGACDFRFHIFRKQKQTGCGSGGFEEIPAGHFSLGKILHSSIFNLHYFCAGHHVLRSFLVCRRAFSLLPGRSRLWQGRVSGRRAAG